MSYLDNIAQCVYLMNVGLKHIYSVLYFNDGNKANIFILAFRSKKLF